MKKFAAPPFYFILCWRLQSTNIRLCKTLNDEAMTDFYAIHFFLSPIANRSMHFLIDGELKPQMIIDQTGFFVRKPQIWCTGLKHECWLWRWLKCKRSSKKVPNWSKHYIHQENLKPHALLIFIRPRFDNHCRHSFCHPCCWDLTDVDVEDFNSEWPL